MMKKSIVLLLVFCLTLGIFSSCSSTQESKDPTSASSSTTASQSVQQTTPPPAEPFPGADLGGVTIKVTGMQNPETADEAKKEMWRNRAKAVEEKFNCKLVFDALQGIEWNDVPNAVITSLAAGDPVVDFGEMSRYYISDLMTNNAILDLTAEVAAFNLPKPYYEGGCQWADKTVGFSRNPMLPWSAIVYNRDMIKAAGMAKTPGELFKEGKWSLTEFYDYCAELKTKLPKDVNVFGIHSLNWARGAAFANGASMMDPVTYVPTYTNDAFYEVIEVFQKMVVSGLAVNATEVTRDDGTTGYDWNPAQAGFADGKLAMCHGDDWDFQTFASKFDFGVVPFPWGSKVTIQNNDYKTLSDNYRNYYKDCGVYVVVKGAEKKATPEQYKNLLFSYLEEEGTALLSNMEKASKGEMIASREVGQPRNFTSDLDIELWDWYASRGKFEPTDTTAVSNVFFRALYKVCATNENARSSFESVVVQDTYALIEAGLVDKGKLSEEMKGKVDAYAVTVTPAPQQ